MDKSRLFDSRFLRLERLERFFNEVELNEAEVARLVVQALGLKGKPWHLALDRTNWQFGKTDLNILVLSVAHDDLARGRFRKTLDADGCFGDGRERRVKGLWAVKKKPRRLKAHGRPARPLFALGLDALRKLFAPRTFFTQSLQILLDFLIGKNPPNSSFFKDSGTRVGYYVSVQPPLTKICLDPPPCHRTDLRGAVDVRREVHRSGL